VTHAGLLTVWSARPLAVPIALSNGGFEIERPRLAELGVNDPSISRRHARIRLDAGVWTIRDLGSRNGTFVDGLWAGAIAANRPRVLRTGNALFLFTRDLGAHTPPRRCDGALLGAAMQALWNGIERAAARSRPLHLVGESGSGKELAARHYHAARPGASGPFVAVNCALPPHRLLSPAPGTLFLDHVEELDARAQLLLLDRLARGPLPIVTATNTNLGRLVEAGRFHRDLGARLSAARMSVPPLRERADEIPAIIENTLAAHELRAHASLVETALLRHWPGNVRELIVEIRAAASRALAFRRAEVRATDLCSSAGTPLALD
jgi:transcriptional regulator of acetoin/glycerol metabolism